MLGLALLWVGAVLFLNGLWLLGRIGDREIAIINIFSGLVTAAVAAYLAFGPGADDQSIRAAALTLLFSFTYLWVAYNRFQDVDGRGLGWYSLFVAITVVPVAVVQFMGASSALGYWLGVCWAAWAVLWFMFFLLLAMQKPIVKATGAMTSIQGVLTAWLPGYLILEGWLV